MSQIDATSCPNLAEVKTKATSSRKRKLSGDERLNRNRERNKIHARKTRERKKIQTMTLQMRIKELEEEGARLRTLVDETYIAGSLLGLRDSFNQDGETVVVKTASSICGNFYELQCASQLLSKEDEKKDCNEAPTPVPSKRIRRTGRYDPQEREKKRRERNKMHAKKTREKKKQFFEESEKMISAMVREHTLLREYLISVKAMTRDEDTRAKQRDIEAEKEIENLKLNSSDDESETNGDSPDSPKVSSNYLDEDEEDVSNYNDKDDEKFSNCSSNTTKEDAEDTSVNHPPAQSSSKSHDGDMSGSDGGNSLTSKHLLKSAASKNSVLNSKFNGFYDGNEMYRPPSTGGTSSSSNSSSSSSSSSDGFTGHFFNENSSSNMNESSKYAGSDANMVNADSDSASVDNNKSSVDEQNFEVKSDGTASDSPPNTESYHHGIDSVGAERSSSKSTSLQSAVL